MEKLKIKPTLVFASPPPAPVLEKASQSYTIVMEPNSTMKVERLIEEAIRTQAVGLVVSPSQLINAAVLDRLPSSVKIISTSSVGFNHLDIAAGRAKNIQMTNTPDVLTECTADFTMLLLMAACRRLPEYQAIMNQGWGKFFGQSEMLGLKVSGRTLGILGMGRIGQAVAARARGFGMKVLYSNRNRLSPDLEQGAQYFAGFDEMLPHCEVLSLHAPAGPSTEGIMNLERFKLLPPRAVFINTGRGNLMDESALIEALRSGLLFAAGLDVFASEPNFNRTLASFPNVVLAPHMGSATVETRSAMGFRVLANIDSALSGLVPRDLLL